MQTGVINRADLDDLDVALWTDACDRQLVQVCRAWDVPYSPVMFYTSTEELPVADGRVQLLTLVKSLDVPGADGLHQNLFGLIFSRVEAHDEQRTVLAMSHEIIEAKVNPRLDGWVVMPDGRQIAHEIADPVEDWFYLETGVVGTIRRPVPVSNYVLPSYFDPKGKYPYDRMGKLTAPFSLTPGGYYVTRDAADVRTLVFASHARPMRQESRGLRLASP